MSGGRSASGARWVERHGPWAVVTGASDGIGRALARGCAARGLNLVLVARRKERLEDEAATLMKTFGIQCLVIVLDLGHPSASQALLDTTADLDVGLLVAAAGYGTSGAMIENAIDAEADMLSVNCGSTLVLSHGFGKRMAARGRGGMVLFSSILAFQGVALAANYAATKAYVQTLAEGLNAEFSPRGVSVLACAPGPVRTGFAKRAGLSVGMALAPEVVAEAVLRAVGGGGTHRPGWLSRILTLSMVGQTRTMRSFILGRVMRSMVQAATAAKARSAA